MTTLLRLLPLAVCLVAWAFLASALLYGRDVIMRGF